MTSSLNQGASALKDNHETANREETKERSSNAILKTSESVKIKTTNSYS